MFCKMLKNVAKKIKIKELQKKKSNRKGFKIGAYSDKSSLLSADSEEGSNSGDI